MFLSADRCHSLGFFAFSGSLGIEGVDIQEL